MSTEAFITEYLFQFVISTKSNVSIFKATFNPVQCTQKKIDGRIGTVNQQPQCKSALT